MSQSNEALAPREELPPVRRACIPPNLTYETMSELGRALFDLSQEIAASGERLLSEDEIEQRRGGEFIASRGNGCEQDELPPVRRAYIPPNLSYETMSEMGRELFDLSQEYEAAGERLYSEVELEKELARRKGGYIPNDNGE